MHFFQNKMCKWKVVEYPKKFLLFSALMISNPSSWMAPGLQWYRDQDLDIQHVLESAHVWFRKPWQLVSSVIWMIPVKIVACTLSHSIIE